MDSTAGTGESDRVLSTDQEICLIFGDTGPGGCDARNEMHAEAQFAHDQRLVRLQAIQQELAKLADLGRRLRSVKQMREQPRSRLHLVNKA